MPPIPRVTILRSEAVAERRSRRSSDRLVALTELLERARRRLRLLAIVLADDSGCVIAGAGPYRYCEELAALGADRAGQRQPALGLRGGLSSTTWQLDGMGALLCASSRIDIRHLEQLEDGCRRILGYRKTA